MAYDPSIFNINPYYDDFDANKGFLRVLFKPGYALQARELTQLQSILQDQVSRVGDHLFKDGSRIVGGGISVRNSQYIMVNAGSGTAIEGVTDYETFVGGTLTDSSGNSARIVHYLEPDPDTDNKLILVVDFTSGSAFSGTLTFTKEDLEITGLVTSSTQTSGECKVVSVSDGIFYVDGFFVRVQTQHYSPFTITDGYRDLSFDDFTVLSKKVGFYVNRDSVTEQEDSTLRDPSIGSYNYNAPGADRYKIILSLGQADLDETPNDFVELLRFENGKITKKIDRVTYGDIEKALARRTYDESGSYTVKPFDVVIKPNSSTILNASISGGKAYVLGYEVENQYPQTVPFNKARTTQTENRAVFPYTTGNKVGVLMSSNANFGLSFAQHSVTIGSGSAAVRFFDSSNSVIATGYVHGAIPNPIEENTSDTARIGYEYDLYLYGISGNVSNGVSGCIYLNTTGTTVSPFIPSAPNAKFVSSLTDYSSLVFPMEPGYAVDTVQSAKIIGKLISDRETPVTVTTTGTVTKYVISRDLFANSVGAVGSSVFRFLQYGTGNETNSTDLQDVTFIKSTGTDASLAMKPFANGARIYTNPERSTLTIEIPFAPAQFQSGTIQAVCPLEYTPSITAPSTYRTKVSTDSQQTAPSFTNVVDENGRRYFLLANRDVYSIVSVTANGVDYTNDFELDDGQRDTHYDFSRLYVKESLTNEGRYSSGNGLEQVTLTIAYRYFQHGGLACAPFIGRHSYPDIPYDQIPLYTDRKSGKTVSLANCLDFRRSGLTATTPMLKPFGRAEFSSARDAEITYTHYLPRVDKLCVKADPEDGSPLFFFVTGTPDLAPIAPPDPEDALVIATVTVPAYTHNASDVVVTAVENKRYTMGDIGKIQKRVDEVEVFAKLSLSELEAESTSLRDSSDQMEPLKTSIFSDEFYGHSVADVSDTAYSCSVDYERGELRPFFTETPLTLPQPQVSADTVVTSDGIAMLNYTETPHVENTQYTKTVAINPSNTVNWLGFMSLSRTVEPLYDYNYRPVIKTNALMENDNWISANSNNSNGFGTQWNSWDSIWTGIEEVEEEQDDIQKRIVSVPHSSSASAVPSFNSGSVKIGTSRTVESVDQKTGKFIRARKLKNRVRYNVGSRVVDRSVVPYIPARSGVVATVHGLKPNMSDLALYIDGEVIKSGIRTNENGSVVGDDGTTIGVTFDIPAQRFLAGSRTVRISNTSNTVAADAVYHCTGILEQRDSGSYSTRPPEFRRQTTGSEAIAKDPFNRDIDSVENTHWSDPLSQTFFVDKKTTPDGAFISSVTLFFSEKDDTLPVTVQIRPTVGGYPSPSVVVPFSTVTLMPSEVNADSSPTGTVFTFSTPVYLEPGEWSICILTNSGKYTLFAAESAINAVSNSSATSGRAGNNQLVGTLYSPQGFGPAVQDNITDLMFTVNRCEFTSPSGTVTWSDVGNVVGAQIVKIYAPELITTSALVSRRIDEVAFKNNDAIYLKTLFGTSPDIVYTLTAGFAVSPVIDTQAMYAVAVKMFQTPSTEPPVSSRYVSRVVELPEDLVSNGIAVLLDANLPSGTGVQVWCRYSANGETDIFTKPWTLVPLVSPTPRDPIKPEKPFTSVSEIDFRTAYYKSNLPLDTDFKAYQVRVDIISDVQDPSYYNTPAVRNIKAISFSRTV